MELSRELESTEFDWFAIDLDGRVALFATAGSGTSPESVRTSVEKHDAIGAALEATGWGTPAVWQSYSRVGLFAYDWSDPQGCYVRVAEPIVPLSTALAVCICTCSTLPKLNVSFTNAHVIQPNWQNGT
jgi:hypothetical protein